jgi:dTDP-4-amino-4,6-dideoxygalactose transaminase
MPAILEIARRRELLIIEDCAQAHGARFGGRPAGAWGDLAAFSFYPTKNLGAFGDGGMVVTSDPGLAQRLRVIREYGWTQRYVSSVPGVNSRLDELQAAILAVRLASLERENERRREIASAYDRLLATAGLVTPARRADATHAFHQYVIRSPDRDGLRERLAKLGVQTAIHYPVPVHRQPAYERCPRGPAGLTHSEAAAREVLSLPMHGFLSDEQVSAVAAALAPSPSGRGSG